MDDYERWYGEAMHESNAAGYAGVTAAQTIAHQAACITELEAQLAEAKKDADRYQWLRGEGLNHIDFEGLSDETCDVGLDYAIDAAIAEGRSKHD